MLATAKRTTGRRVELGRYRTPEGTRVLTGRRIDGVVHIYDLPVDHADRGYFVEAGFRSRAELAVLVADYRRHAERHGACPMGLRGLDHIIDGPIEARQTSNPHGQHPSTSACKAA